MAAPLKRMLPRPVRASALLLLSVCALVACGGGSETAETVVAVPAAVATLGLDALPPDGVVSAASELDASDLPPDTASTTAAVPDADDLAPAS